MTWNWMAVAACCGLLLAPPVSADEAEVPVQWLQGLGDVRYHRVEASELERGFHVYVSLPRPSAEAADLPLTTVYLLDGGGTFPTLAGQHHYLRLGDAVEPAILVGISYGSIYFRDGNFRSTDFTAPSVERDFWGGAPAFQSFLADTLMPMIEALYPSDPDRRYLFGQSLGGQFVLYSAQTRPALFAGHIASNPALHRNLDFFLDWRGEGDAPVDATRLFVSLAENDHPQFRGPALAWVDHWRGQVQRPFVLEVRELPGQTHFSALSESFTQGILWLSRDESDPP